MKFGGTSVATLEKIRKVAKTVNGLKKIGVQSGDRVATILPNRIEALVSLLASASIGAIWTSCSPDFGTKGIIDRIGQTKPRVLFTSSSYYYNIKEHDFSYQRVRSGLEKMLWGFFKKIVIADNLAILVDGIYNNVDSYSGIALIIATIFFTFQIYCDFSGYSDIAIGTAKVMGFELRENFKRPYFSKSIREFWQRWHITLSTWFRDYVYISLGGNRVIKWRWYYNILITFLLSGLWHGANWTFIIWGALHGFYLITALLLSKPKEKIFKIIKNISPQLNKIMDVALTFILVAFAWIFFRANSLSDAIYVITNLFGDYESIMNINSIKMQFRGIGLYTDDIIKSCILIIILITYSLYERGGNVWEKLSQKPRWYRWAIYYILIFGILFVAPHSAVNNFIYFQF